MRNYRQGDGEGWLALVRAAPDFPYAFFNRSPSLDALCMVVAHPHMDAAHNLLFVECIDQLVGYAELWRAAGRERSTGRVLVHPD